MKKGEVMSIYDTLNEQQKEAVFHTEGPLLILSLIHIYRLVLTT